MWLEGVPDTPRRVLIRTAGYYQGENKKGEIYEPIFRPRKVSIQIGKYDWKWMSEEAFFPFPKVTGWKELPEC